MLKRGWLLIAGVASLWVAGCSMAPDKPAPQPPPAAAKSAAAAPSPPSLPSPSVLQELSVREERGQTTLIVKLAQPVTQYRHFSLTQPARIVLDILDVSKGAAAEDTYRIDTNWVSALRLNANEKNIRLVLEIAGAAVPPYTISPENGGLSIVVGALDPKATARKNVTLVKDGKRADLATEEFSCPSSRELKAPAATPDREVTGEKQYTGQKISLEFKDADIKNVFRLLAEVSGKNILVTDDVNKRITVRLIEVPWDQALDLIVETNGLAKEETGNVLRISTAARLAQDKKAQLDARDAARKIASRQTAYIRVNYAPSLKDLVDRIRQIVKSSPDFSIIPDAIVADDPSNTIVVHGTTKDVQDIACIVSRLDVRTPQVLIESNLVETTPTFARSLGIDLDTLFNKGRVATSERFRAGTPFSGPSFTFLPEGIAKPTPASGFFFGYFGNNVGAILSAAENQGLVKIISRPSVVTLNGVPSTIRSERILRIALPSSTNIASGTGAAAGTAVATERVNVGITLTVTPQVSSDGFVLLKIKVKSSSIANSPTVTGGTAGVIPFDELNREAEANVLVRDGETIVIGGILKDTAQDSTGGVPYLKDIPVLGWLFKNWSVQKDLEELIVFITPRIAAAGSGNLPTAEQLWREQMRKTQGEEAASAVGGP
ncbi:MAG TPA: type IV pilus secretin PilQ [Candidatus Binatia bacterium]|nr:type IV pilus secretin PilQ [Candidatus Binatia bacterium]